MAYDNNTSRTGASTGSTGLRDWNTEDTYWRDNYRSRPYAASSDYNTLQPAYRYGYDLYGRNQGKRFEDIDENDARSGWENMKDKVSMKWEQAKDAVRDAYNRMTDDNDTTGTSRTRTTETA